MTGVILDRHLKLETVQVEEFSAVDGQGKPSYTSPVDVEARVIRQDKLVVLADGSQITTQLTVWFPGGTTPLLDNRDRVTFSGELFIVMQTKDVKDRDAQLAHRRVRCRRE